MLRLLGSPTSCAMSRATAYDVTDPERNASSPTSNALARAITDAHGACGPIGCCFWNMVNVWEGQTTG
jgi:hypothetical protein